MRKNKEQEKRQEKGVLLFAIVFVVFLAMVIGVLLFLPEREEKSGIISSVLAEEDVSASPERETDYSSMPETASSPTPESIASSLPEDKEEKTPPSSVKILGLPEEVLSLLHCTERKLAGEMKEFFNANGFADVAEVAYEKETVISHGDNSVSACFSLEREGEAYEVCCIYSRDSEERSIVIWE